MCCFLGIFSFAKPIGRRRRAEGAGGHWVLFNVQWKDMQSPHQFPTSVVQWFGWIWWLFKWADNNQFIRWNDIGTTPNLQSCRRGESLHYFNAKQSAIITRYKYFNSQKLLCAYAFPHCMLNSEGLTLKLPLCYEGECSLFLPHHEIISNKTTFSSLRLRGHPPPVLLQWLGPHRGEEAEGSILQITRQLSVTQLHGTSSVQSKAQDVFVCWTYSIRWLQSYL